MAEKTQTGLLGKALTVQGLIDSLMEIEDKEKPVVFTYDYNDHWHSMVAQPIMEVKNSKVEYSSYHRMLKLDKEVEEDDDFEGEGSNCVILL